MTVLGSLLLVIFKKPTHYKSIQKIPTFRNCCRFHCRVYHYYRILSSKISGVNFGYLKFVDSSLLMSENQFYWSIRHGQGLAWDGTVLFYGFVPEMCVPRDNDVGIVPRTFVPIPLLRPISVSVPLPWDNQLRDTSGLIPRVTTEQ